ncbi:MAG: MFS transporter, partial [Gammaproteobacteria bacterium]
SALASKNYRIFLYGNIVSLMGVWIQRLAIGWQAWELSQSPVIVGLVAALHLLPSIVLTPFFGVLVDRVNTRHAAIATHVAMTLISLGMGVITLTGDMSTTWLLLLSLLHGIANSAYSPIRLTLIVDLVEKQQYPSAVAITSMTFNLSRFVGPAIAGWIVAVYGLGVAYLANAVTYVPLIISFLLITIKPHDGGTTGPGGYLDQLVEGLRYTLDHTLIRNIILIASTSSLFGRGILELLPAFAALVFEGGSNVLATFMAVAGIGALGTSLFFSVRSGTSHLYRIVLIGAVGVGVSVGLFAAVNSLLGGIIVVTMLGVCTSLVSIGSQIQVQLSVEDRLRARVMSLWSLIIFGGPAVGGIVAGIAVRELGTTNTLIIFAACCLMLNFLFARRWRIDSE